MWDSEPENRPVVRKSRNTILADRKQTQRKKCRLDIPV
jgi:hypothetical protein